MKKLINEKYPFQVWAIAIALSPLFICLKLLINQKISNSILTTGKLYIVTVIIGLLASLPTFIIYFMSFKIVLKITAKTVEIKIILTIIAIVGMWLTLIFLAARDARFDEWTIRLSYLLGILIPASAFNIYCASDKGREI